MYLTLTTIGQQAIMDAQEGGYKLEIGSASVFRTGTPVNLLPLELTTAMLDGNVQGTWSTMASGITAIDEFNATSPDVFQVVVNLPSTLGDFEFDAIGLYLSNGTLLGMGTYERLIPKVTMGQNKTSNSLELEVFIRFASIATLIKVTRDVLKRPYSYITEYDKADLLGDAQDNAERIYRVTRPSNALGDGKNAFTSFLVHSGTAFFDNQNKPYQQRVWVPSDHLTMFGSDVTACRLATPNTLVLTVPKDQYPMIEHIQSEVPYLISTIPMGNTQPPGELQGRILEATLNVVAEGANSYEISMLLTNSTFQEPSLLGVTFGAVLYASNTDLSAQEAVRVALRKFLEMQYRVGRTYKSDEETDPNDVLYPFLGYRTYWQKLNGIVEASTSTTDGRMASSGQIYDLPDYATGGETLLAPVIRATNIWLRYDPSGSGAITYDLSADRTSVNEGGSVRFTLRTTGLTNGSMVAYTITGIDQADLATGNLTGYFTINNNVGIADFILAMDETTEGVEDMRLFITQDPTVFKVVSVQDTSVSLNLTAFFAVSPTASSGITQMNEGDTRYFVCQVVGIADGTYVYPSILGSSVADVYDLSQAIPSSVRVVDGRVSFPITATADRQTEGDELLAIGLYRDAGYTDSLVTASVTIKDTSRASTVNMYFSDSAVGGADISNTVVNEGTYVYLVVETTGYANATTMALRYGNSANPSTTEVSDSDFASARPSTLTLDANGRGVVAYPILNDYAKDNEDINTLETFNVEISTTDNSTILARTMISIKDTSTLDGGAFTLTDITDSANPVVVYNSKIDKIATMNPSSPSGLGINNPSNIFNATMPIDIGMRVGRKYRLTWIQSETASSAITRVALSMGDEFTKSYGVGLGTKDLNSATAGKPLSMIKDSNNVTLGYGAVFEFEVTSPASTPTYPSATYALVVSVYYPNGVPGLTFPTGYTPTIRDNWGVGNQSFIPLTENGNTPSIRNLYGGSYDPKYTFQSKHIALPFGSVMDLLIISQSGSGGTSSLATSGAGVDGQDGRNISIRIPKYVGTNILEANQPIRPGTEDDPLHEYVTINPTDLWDSILDITGGTKGKSQNFDQARTDLGGVSGSYSFPANKGVILAGLEESRLFARAGNETIEYEIICEVLHSVTGKDYQKGASTNANQAGGLGFLPQGSINTPDNIRGAGGKGGASIGTGFGYAGGGGSGSIYVIRLGTRILTENLTASPTLGPVSFFLVDSDSVVRPETDAVELRTPFNRAVSTALIGANKGVDGSELHVVQLNYAKDGFSYMETESLIGSGSAEMFVRPTHNDLAVPTLPLKAQTDWDDTQFSQMAIGKYGISRILLMPTGVEGEYVDGTSATVDGLPSKPTNLLMYPTLDPKGTPPETKGSTLVFVASALADADSNPVLTKSKLGAMQNTTLLASTVKNGATASADGDNEYSRGGYVELFISNNSTTGKAFIAELPRVTISEDNPLKVVDATPYDTDKTWSNNVDADGNSESSLGYMLAQGDGALSFQNYQLSNIPSIRPWIDMPVKPTGFTDTNAPIIINQGQAVTLTVVGGGGAVSTRDPDAEVTTPDTAFNGQGITLSIKSLSADTFTDFLVCSGGVGSIDNSTNATPADSVATFDPSVVANCLYVVGTPVLLNGTSNPIKGTHGGDGSGSYAKVTLMNYYPSPVVIKATGGKGGSGESTLQATDGVVLVTVN